MSNREGTNAIIEKAELTTKDGHLDCWLTLKLQSGGHQGFGGYALYLPKSYRHHSKSTPAGHYLYRIMEVAGVVNFDAMKGKCIRVVHKDGLIHSVGHIVNDDWFTPSEDLKDE